MDIDLLTRASSVASWELRRALFGWLVGWLAEPGTNGSMSEMEMAAFLGFMER